MTSFLKISDTTTLGELADRVGTNNVQYMLAANNLEWTPSVGKSLVNQQSNAASSSENIEWQRKSTILNTLTDSSDVFETVSLMNETGWKILSSTGSLPGTLKIPDSVSLPSATDIIGDGNPVPRMTYEKAMEGLQNPPHNIDPSIFNEYSSIKPTQIVDTSRYNQSSDTFQYFNIPWGEVTLYSTMDGESVDFPVYPEEVSDARSANYSTMPDMLYQYEPWYVYNSSGPRTNTYKFDFHRQMWSGDESDGMANDLIRFCEAQLYPKFNGSAVNGPMVRLYASGNILISGIMNDVSVSWDGPILNDGWYAHCQLELTITEIAEQALTYDSVRQLPTIG